MTETAGVQALLQTWASYAGHAEAPYERFLTGDLLTFWRVSREARRCAERDGVVHGTRRVDGTFGELPSEQVLRAHAEAVRAGRWWPEPAMEVHVRTVTPAQSVAPGSPVATKQRRPAKVVVDRELVSTVLRVRLRWTPLGWRISDRLEQGDGSPRWVSSAICTHPLASARDRGLTADPLLAFISGPNPERYTVYLRLANAGHHPRQVSPSKDPASPRWWVDGNSTLTVSTVVRASATRAFDTGILSVWDGPRFGKPWQLGMVFSAPGPHHPELDGSGWCPAPVHAPVALYAG